MKKNNKKTTNQYHVFCVDDDDLIVEATTPEDAINNFLKETNYPIEEGDKFEVYLMSQCGTWSATIPPPPRPKLTKIS